MAAVARYGLHNLLVYCYVVHATRNHQEPRIEFDYLVGNASKFLRSKAAPPRWMFCQEIQVAIAGRADLGEAAEFRKRLFSSIHSKKTRADVARVLRS